MQLIFKNERDVKGIRCGARRFAVMLCIDLLPLDALHTIHDWITGTLSSLLRDALRNLAKLQTLDAGG